MVMVGPKPLFCLFVVLLIFLFLVFSPEIESQGEAKNLEALLSHPNPGLGLFVAS